MTRTSKKLSLATNGHQNPPNLPSGLNVIQVISNVDNRKLSIGDLLSRMSMNEISVKDRESPVQLQEYLAEMLWSLIVTGRARYADGVEVRMPNLDQWLKVVKWVTERIDGPAPKEVLIKKQSLSASLDLSGYSIEDLERLKDLTARLTGGEE